jgi:hypothetical protein
MDAVFRTYTRRLPGSRSNIQSTAGSAWRNSDVDDGSTEWPCLAMLVGQTDDHILDNAVDVAVGIHTVA